MGVTGSQENSEKKPVVLIIGGGYGGVQCAKLLDKTGQFFVVLIDRKSYFLHNVAALRATVEQDFARKIIVPYDRLLTNGLYTLIHILKSYEISSTIFI
jgi:NADH dehydrogenase FAD-containing subunit